MTTKKQVLSSLLFFLVGAGCMSLLGQQILLKKISAKASIINTSSPLGASAVSTSTPLSFFQKHNVGQGAEFARIPMHFCRSIYGELQYNCGRSNQSFWEIDARLIPLPLETMTSAATDGINTIAYMAGQGCPNSLFVHKVTSQTDQKDIALKGDAIWWHCGDEIETYVESVSPGGKFIRIISEGKLIPHENGWHTGYWLYDIEKDRVDPETAQSPFVVFLGDHGESVLFVKTECGSKALLDDKDPCLSSSTFMLRDNTSGKTVRLEAIERQLKNAGVRLSQLSNLTYSTEYNGRLEFTDDGNRTWLDVDNVNDYVPKLN